MQLSVSSCVVAPARYTVWFADTGVTATLGHASGSFLPDYVLAKDVPADSSGGFQVTVTIPKGAPKGQSAIGLWESYPVEGNVQGACLYLTVQSNVTLDLWDPFQPDSAASTTLGNALTGNGMPKPTAGPTAAHHIIPSNIKHPDAANARALAMSLCPPGFLDTADNGVWLPYYPRYGSNPVPGAIHSVIHTPTYMETLWDRIKGATTCDELKDILHQIRAELLANTFPY